MRVAFLGPPGTFSEEAVQKYQPLTGWERVAHPTIADAYDAVASGAADRALLPIENSLEGSVGATLDLLVHRPGPLICGELNLPVEHHLLAKPGVALDQVTRVFSHPQALGQCAGFLRQKLPKAVTAATHSTADAARQVRDDGGRDRAAAIASRMAAERYGLALLASSIQDGEGNTTRFVVIGKDGAATSGRDRTSIALTLDRDRPGGLHEILGELAAAGINLSKIESRPMKQALGHYIFFIDLEAHAADAVVAKTLAAIRSKAHQFFFLGSYPRA